MNNSNNRPLEISRAANGWVVRCYDIRNDSGNTPGEWRVFETFTGLMAYLRQYFPDPV